jgi:hypothetical protein
MTDRISVSTSGNVSSFSISLGGGRSKMFMSIWAGSCLASVSALRSRRTPKAMALNPTVKCNIRVSALLVSWRYISPPSWMGLCVLSNREMLSWRMD